MRIGALLIGLASLCLADCSSFRLEHDIERLTDEFLTPRTGNEPGIPKISRSISGETVRQKPEDCQQPLAVSNLTSADYVAAGTTEPSIAYAAAAELRSDPDSYIRKALSPILQVDESDKKLGAGELARVPAPLQFIAKIILIARDHCVLRRLDPIQSASDFAELTKVVAHAHAHAINLPDAVKAKQVPQAVAGSSRPCSQPTSPTPASPAVEVTGGLQALALYEYQYFQGGFINRFGTKIAQPKLSTTISDDTIGGATQVFVEWLADYLLRTPMYCTSSGVPGKPIITFLPTASASPPTASKWTMVDQVAAVEDSAADSNVGRITPLKASVVQFGSNAIASGVTTISGGFLDSVGGFELGIVVAGVKFSVGDNKTLNVMAKTAIETASRRMSEHLLYKAMLRIDSHEIPAEWKAVFASAPKAGS